MKRTVLWSAVLVLCAGAVAAQTTGSAPPHPPLPVPVSFAVAAPEDQAPAEFLQAMRSQFHPGVARYLGVTAPRDIDHTEVGRVIRTYQVNLPQLQAYDGTSPATGILSEAPTITRLVTVRGKIQSALVLVNVGEKWELSRVGESARAAAIDRVTAALATNGGVVADSTFLVQVPGLGVEFIAFGGGTTIQLASLWDHPGVGLAAGEPRPAEAVLASLASAARNVPTN